MAKIQINLKSFKSKAYRKRKGLQKFMNKLQRKAPKGIDALAKKLDAETWKDLDCLACANCCKTMTPTYTKTDVKKIATFLNITPAQMHQKWLTVDEDNGDIINKSTPCQFLNKDNKCSVYTVRPADCSGFPHFKKREILDYTHVFNANLHRCPATLKWVELMEKNVKELKLVK
jgi:Fe-S-cluster containining protein